MPEKLILNFFLVTFCLSLPVTVIQKQCITAHRSYAQVHHVQDTITNQVETGENHNIMFIQCTPVSPVLTWFVIVSCTWWGGLENEEEGFQFFPCQPPPHTLLNGIALKCSLLKSDVRAIPFRQLWGGGSWQGKKNKEGGLKKKRIPKNSQIWPVTWKIHILINILLGSTVWHFIKGQRHSIA